MNRKNWWELLAQKKEEEKTPWKYTPPSERYKRPEPTVETAPLEIRGRTRGIGITTPEIIEPEKPSRTRGIGAEDIREIPETKDKVQFVRTVPEGWYKEGKLIDTIQTFNSSLLQVGYMSKQFFHDMGTKLLNQPVAEDVEVGGRYGEKKIIPMDIANERKRENILAGQKAYDATKKGYEALLMRHPEWVPRIEYQGSFIENIKQNPMMLVDPGYISQIASESLAFSLGTMTITAAATAASGGNIFVGGLTMFMTMYPQEAQGMFETLKEHGFTEDEALKTTTWSAALITAIEASEDVYLLTKLVPGLRKPIVESASNAIAKTLVKPTIRSYFQTAGTEAFKTVGMETGEEIAQALTEDLTIRIVDKTHEVLPDLAEITGRTIVSSLGFGAISGYQSGIQQYRQNMITMAMEADKVKNDNPDIKKSVNEMLKAVKKAEEEETTPKTPIKTGSVYIADVFRGKKEGVTPTDEGLFGSGTYFSTSEEYAATYGKVKKTKVKLYNPFVINDQKEADAFFDKYTRPERKKAIDEGKTPKEANEIAAKTTNKKLVDLGYDGIIARDIIEKGDEVVVFDVPKSEIKIAEPTLEELDVSGTVEQVEQADITYAGTEEVGDVEAPKVEPELDESLFTAEEQEIYTEQKPLEQIKAEEDKLRETLKTETKSLKEFERQKQSMESLYKKYVRTKRDELNKERSKPKDEIEAIAFGQVQMRTPVHTKTEWKEALGPGHYAKIFSTNPNLSRPDVIANVSPYQPKTGW